MARFRAVTVQLGRRALLSVIGGLAVLAPPASALTLQSVSSISCPTVSLCVAGDTGGNILTSTNPTGGAGAWTLTNVVGTDTVAGVSCASSSLCVAVDSAGSVLSSTDPTGGAAAWHVVALPPPSGSPTPLTGVSCPSTTLCVLTGPAEIWTSADPTGGVSAWALTSIGSLSDVLTGVSCPSTWLCVATDATGFVLASTDPTGGPAAWPMTAVGLSAPAGISCSTTSQCVAFGGNGIDTSTNPTGGSGAWTATGLGTRGLTGVSCPTAKLCVAADPTGTIFTTTNPTGSTSAWTTRPVDPGNALHGVSCASPRLCVAGAHAGQLAISTQPTAGRAAWPVIVVPPGGTPALSASPTALSFASRSVGRPTSPPLTAVITNTGSATAQMGAVSVTGPGAGAFAAVQNTCSGTTLLPTASCTVGVAFTPSGTGSAQATLAVTSNSPLAPLVIPMTGTGTSATGPAASLIWIDRPPAGGQTFSVARASTDGGQLTQDLIDLNDLPGSVAQDAQHIYWAYGAAIGRANLHGTGVSPNFIPGVRAQEIAVGSGYIYWIDAVGATNDLTIGRANLDGSGVNPSFLTVPHVADIDAIFGLAVSGGRLYWTQLDVDVGARTMTADIGRAKPDGSNLNSQFVNVGSCSFTITPPAQINGGCAPGAIAVNGQYIVTEFGTNTNTEQLYRANLDGSGGQLLPGLAAGPLAVDSQYIYAATSGAVQRYDFNGIGAGSLPDPLNAGTGVSVSPPGAQALATGPVDGATKVAATANLYAVFSLPMNQAATDGAFSVVDDSTGQTVPGSVSWYGATVPVFTPSSGYLQPGHRFTATISTAATTTDGTPLANLIVWSFTVARNPVIEQISPGSGATEVASNSPVVAVFSQPMNPAATQAAFSLTEPGGASVKGSFSWYGPTALIFTPSGALAPGAYTATVSATATDQSGFPLVTARSWAFTAGGPADRLADGRRAMRLHAPPWSRAARRSGRSARQPSAIRLPHLLLH